MPSLLPELIQTPARNSSRKKKFVKVLNHSVITFASDLPMQKSSPRAHHDLKVKKVFNQNSKPIQRANRHELANPIYM